MVQRIGGGPFRGVFSLLSIAALVFLVRAWHAAPSTLLWVAADWLRWLLVLAMLPAFVLFVASVSGPNPTMIGSSDGGAQSPRGVIRVTRHPMLWSFAIWAAVHIIGNGDAAAIIFFGAFLVTALAGMPSIDAKLARRDRETWQAVSGATSIVPFVAIAQGRNQFVAGELGRYVPSANDGVAQDAPDREEEVEITFEQGVPIEVNGKGLGPVEIVQQLNEIGGRNAIGRVDLVENRFVGIKSRGIYETPGGTLLMAAHRELEAMTLEREVKHYKQQIALKYAELVYFGLWFTPLREALDGFVATTQKSCDWTVKLALYKGNVSIAGRTQFALYSSELSSFTMGDSLRPERRRRFHSHSWLAGAHPHAPEKASGDCSVKCGRADFVSHWTQRSMRWQRSFRFDWRLIPYEVVASKAHARALAKSARIIAR